MPSGNRNHLQLPLSSGLGAVAVVAVTLGILRATGAHIWVYALAAMLVGLMMIGGLLLWLLTVKVSRVGNYPELVQFALITAVLSYLGLFVFASRRFYSGPFNSEFWFELTTWAAVITAVVFLQARSPAPVAIPQKPPALCWWLLLPGLILSAILALVCGIMLLQTVRQAVLRECLERLFNYDLGGDEVLEPIRFAVSDLSGMSAAFALIGLGVLLAIECRRTQPPAGKLPGELLWLATSHGIALMVMATCALSGLVGSFNVMGGPPAEIFILRQMSYSALLSIWYFIPAVACLALTLLMLGPLLRIYLRYFGWMLALGVLAVVDTALVFAMSIIIFASVV